MSEPTMPSSNGSGRAVGMRDIAKALGVSTGTVDRALNNKPGINAVTRQRVLKMARAMGYQPNLAARFLSSRKEILVAVNLPRSSALFFDDVWSGIQDGARPFEGKGARVMLRRHASMIEGEVEAFEAALDEDPQAIIICPGDPEHLRPLIERAAQRGIAVLCLTTDAPATERLACVYVDHFVSGSIVGELMGQFLPEGGDVMVVTGSLSTFDHAEKLRGFHCAASLFPRLRVAQVIEDHENLEESYAKCRKALLDPGIRAIYAATVNSLPLLSAIEGLGLISKVKVITTDLYPALISYLRSGAVAASLHQRPFNQGRIGFHTVYRYLTEGVCPTPVVRLVPHIVLRSNLEVFLERKQTYSGLKTR
jgi:LacI family transcriptional regulator